MTFILVGDDRHVVLPELVPPGPYELEVREGVVVLHPLVRASSSTTAPTAPPVPAAPTASGASARPAPPPAFTTTRPTVRKEIHGARDFKGRSWSKVPRGTRLTGPRAIGSVVMGASGELSNGRTPNQHLTDNGLTANAWQVFHLDDGRSVGTAYDMGEWS